MNAPSAPRTPRSPRGWGRLPMLGAVAAIALLTSGCSLWGWGFNGHLDVGDGTNTDRLSPVQIGSSQQWAAQAGVCAIAQKDNTLWCWGDNTTPQQVNSGGPVQIGTATWKVISGVVSGCGIQTDNTLWCFTRTGGLVQVGTATWKSISGLGLAEPGQAVCGIQTDDTLWCWYSGAAPTQVGTATWKSVERSYENDWCGIQTNGTLW